MFLSIPQLLSTTTHRHCSVNSNTTFRIQLTGSKDSLKFEFPRSPLCPFLPVTRHQPSYSRSFPRKQGSQWTQGIRFTVDISLPVNTAEGRASEAPSSTVPLWCHKPARQRALSQTSTRLAFPAGGHSHQQLFRSPKGEEDTTQRIKRESLPRVREDQKLAATSPDVQISCVFPLAHTLSPFADCSIRVQALFPVCLLLINFYSCHVYSFSLYLLVTVWDVIHMLLNSPF